MVCLQDEEQYFSNKYWQVFRYSVKPQGKATLKRNRKLMSLDSEAENKTASQFYCPSTKKKRKNFFCLQSKFFH